MEVSHYAYNMLKIPGPSDIITIHGDPDMVVECEDNGAKPANAIITKEMNKFNDFATYSSSASPGGLSALKRPTAVVSS
jgi:hypothetical protein